MVTENNKLPTTRCQSSLHAYERGKYSNFSNAENKFNVTLKHKPRGYFGELM